MKTLLIWLVPPFIGAIIGYVTNALAIKMLFRPLKEVRLWGLRLPFTPGILPRRRHELADSIGRMVEQELLTPEIIRERLSRPDVRMSIKNSIASYTQNLLDTPIATLIEKPADPAFSAFFGDLLQDFGKSPACSALIDSLLTFLIEQLGKDNGLLSHSVRELLGNEETQTLQDNLKRYIEQRLGAQSGALVESLSPALNNAYPSITRLLISFLRKAEVHAQLETQGRIFLSHAMGKLNPVQRFFVSAGQYDHTLAGKMPELIDDLIQQVDTLLADREIRERIIAFFSASLRSLIDEQDSRERMIGFVVDFLFSHADTPLKTLIQSISRKDTQELSWKVFDFIKKHLITGDLSFIPRFFKSFIESHRDLTLTGVLSLDTAKKESLDTLLCDKLLSIADEQIGAALKSINVRSLVSDRIDSLDMLRVEHIVLDVMANQLQWINVFGAILGALIGVFQSGFSWLTRGL
ncbi:MAG: DUF445 family protein [Treponema sp.]|jgi:uncharacterized membrane protein YheB (UPF0754 family)|nr:DUF445 family protein [Treponema sp.]